MDRNLSPRLLARLAGLLYVINIVTGGFAEMAARQGLIVSGDPAATAQNILAHEGLFRLGFAAGLVCILTNMPLAAIFYRLFKPVNAGVSFMVAGITLTGSAIEALNLLNHFAPLVLLGDAPYLAAFTPAQLQVAAYLALKLQAIGFSISLSFFGCYGLGLGWLIFRSGFLPRVLGIGLAIGGACYLINSFSFFLAPDLANQLQPYILVPSGLAEISLALWFLAVGLNSTRWQARASVARQGELPA